MKKVNSKRFDTAVHNIPCLEQHKFCLQVCVGERRGGGGGGEIKVCMLTHIYAQNPTNPLRTINKLTCRPKKRSADKFDSFDPSYCQFLIKL